jgi:hypothetical protein
VDGSRVPLLFVCKGAKKKHARGVLTNRMKRSIEMADAYASIDHALDQLGSVMPAGS